MLFTIFANHFKYEENFNPAAGHHNPGYFMQ